MSIVLPGQAEALIGNTGLKVDASDALISAVDRLFGEKVVELRVSTRWAVAAVQIAGLRLFFAGCQWVVARLQPAGAAGVAGPGAAPAALLVRVVPEAAVARGRPHPHDPGALFVPPGIGLVRQLGLPGPWRALVTAAPAALLRGPDRRRPGGQPLDPEPPDDRRESSSWR